MMLSYYLSLLDTEEEKTKLEIVYNQYRATMKKIAQKYLQEQDAEDAVHDAFLKIINCLEKIDEPICHKTEHFVVKIVRNTSKDILKKRRAHPSESFEDLEVEPAGVDISFLENLNIERVLDAIQRIPHNYRDVMEMKVYYALTDKQTAQVLCITYATLRKRVERAREMLRKELNIEGDEL